uniref:Uncharacterized protein n=1 Tax=uncultured marine group II/III euryarchaeote AD1000_33_C07 TaxID=1457756 RepID=A0A075FNS8_9EURY|nr:hypothetical protein [uncultured marine group II/III euryarchaeote AD1000_33_C07]
MIGMVGVEYLSEGHGAGFLGTSGDYVTVLRTPACIVVNLRSSVQCHSLEALVDAVFGSPALDYPEGYSRGPRLGNLVVRVN